jgi:hypothetical protein
VSHLQTVVGPAANNNRLLYGLSFPMSEEAQKDDFVIPVRLPLPSLKQPKLTPCSSAKPRSSAPARTLPL